VKEEMKVWKERGRRNEKAEKGEIEKKNEKAKDKPQEIHKVNKERRRKER
jgi:hypothetical protein